MDDRSPRLTWTDGGAPVSGRFGDVYFSREDGLAESRAVFLGGCGLPESWHGRRRFVVAELGFGTGLNIAALIDLWRRTRPARGRLHLFSIEAYLLTREEAARALSAWPELTEIVDALLAAWPDGAPGFHRLSLPLDWGVTLDLAVAPALEALKQWQGRADAWFLDGFAPAANPEMWSEDVFDEIARLSTPGARLATFTVAGDVRRRLQARGFEVSKRPGHGRKRERLEATAPGSVRGSAPEPKSVAVVGAGIAGLSLARALIDVGLEPLIIDADVPGAGASGFPAALVTPRLDVGDVSLAALFVQALRHARDVYDRLPGAVMRRGVVQLEQTPRDASRFDRVAEQDHWSEGAMRRLTAEVAAEALGEPQPNGGLLMRDARVVSPSAVLAGLRGGVPVRRSCVIDMAADDTEVTLRFEDGGVLRVGAVVLCAGWGNAALAPALELRPVRGQADWVTGIDAPAAAWGGYVAPFEDGLLFGATHDRDRTDVQVSEEDGRRNLATLGARLPHISDRVRAASGRHARAAVRATTPDRLPIAGPLGERVHIIGGLGSRGYLMAPLLAVHVAAILAGAPSPLPTNLAVRVSPKRLLERPNAGYR